MREKTRDFLKRTWVAVGGKMPKAEDAPNEDIPFPLPCLSKSRILETGVDKEGHSPFISEQSEEPNCSYDPIILDVLPDTLSNLFILVLLLSQTKATKTQKWVTVF